MGLETLVSVAEQHPQNAYQAYAHQKENELILQSGFFTGRPDEYPEKAIRTQQLRLIKEAYKQMLWESHVASQIRSYGSSSYVPGQYLDLRI